MTQFDKTIEVDLGRVFGSISVCVGMCVCVVVGVCAGNPVARPSTARKGKHTAGNVQSPVSGVRLLTTSLNYTCWRQTCLHRRFCQIPKDKSIAAIQLGFRLRQFPCMRGEVSSSCHADASSAHLRLRGSHGSILRYS